MTRNGDRRGNWSWKSFPAMDTAMTEFDPHAADDRKSDDRPAARRRWTPPRLRDAGTMRDIARRATPGAQAVNSKFS